MSFILFTSVISLFSFAYSRCVIEVSTSDDPGFAFNQAKSARCSLYFRSGDHTITSNWDWLSWTTIDGGSFADPIEIYGDGRDNTKLTQPADNNQNIFNIGGSFFILRDIELEGGDGGIRVETPTSNAHFKNLKIHSTTNGHAFYTQQETKHILISNIEVYNTDSANRDCFSMGANFHDNIIEKIYCHGNNVKDGISFWETGSYSNIIQDSVIINTANRGIVLQDDNGLGNNIIRNNIILQTDSSAIHIFAGVELYNNIIHCASSKAISASDNGAAKNIKIIGNTIVRAGDICVSAQGWNTNANTFHIANNLFLCGTDGITMQALSFTPSPSVTLNIQNNAFYSTDSAATYGPSNIQLSSISGNVQNYDDYNFYPFSYSQFLNDGIYFTNSTRDIDCVHRGNPSDIGAYEYITSKTKPEFYINPNVVTDITFPELCATSNPTTNAPNTAIPTTSNPTTHSPTTNNPTTAEPTTRMPTPVNPTTSNPTTNAPNTAIPTTSNPTINNPTTAQPTTRMPTTVNPTTSNPTTSVPTTPYPTTYTPTISSPITTSPTTSNPTTFQPTTFQPTTFAIKYPETPTKNPTIITTIITNTNGKSGEIGIDTTIAGNKFNDESKKSDSNESNLLIFYIIAAMALLMFCIIGICILIKVKKKNAYKEKVKNAHISSEISSVSPKSQNISNTFANGYISTNTSKISVEVGSNMLMDDIINEMDVNTHITAGGPINTNDITLNENENGEGNTDENDDENDEEIIEMCNMVTKGGENEINNNVNNAMSPLSVASMSYQSDYNIINDSFISSPTKGNLNIKDDEFVIQDNEQQTKGYMSSEYNNENDNEHQYVTKGNEYQDDDIVDI